MRWSIALLAIAIVAPLWSAQPVTIPVQTVTPRASRSVTGTETVMMSAEQVEVPLSKYADAPAIELERAPDDGSVRVLVALPEKIAIVRIEVMINGRPFPSVRRQRLEQLISADATGEIATRLRKYAETTQRPLTTAEANWLLRLWGDGTSLMTLSENFERSRASQSPVRDVLDRNNDLVIDSQELESAVTILRRCDTNQNDIVEASEIQKAAASMVTDKSTWTPPELLMATSDIAALNHSIGRLFAYAEDNKATRLLASLGRLDVDGNRVISQQEFEAVARMTSDLTIAVDFSDQAGTVTIEDSGIQQTTPWLSHGSTAQREFGGVTFQFAAVRISADAPDQISLGIVNDGFPIAPLLDRDEDGRLSERELREVPQRLEAMDTNNDGKISQDEIRPTIRLAVGYGLCVHDYLAVVRSAAVVSDGDVVGQPRPTPPDWFISLDKNGDGDLSQKEFVGTKDQFLELDQDKDGLISTEEAQSE